MRWRDAGRASGSRSMPESSRPMRVSVGLRQVALVAGFVVCAAAESGASPESLAALLQREAEPSGVVSSICFARVGVEGPLLAREADRLLPPASVQKIITSVAALDILGPDLTLETRLVASRPLERGVLRGDLHLTGEGDPFLVSERLWLLAHDAAAGGLTSVEGRIVVDLAVESLLDSIRGGEDRESPYAAPVSTLGVNFNSISILVRPGGAPGEAARCVFDPCPIPEFGLICEVGTVPSEGAASLEARRVTGEDEENWRVTGTIPMGSAPVRLYRATLRPDRTAAANIRCLLEREGVRVTGGGATGPAPEGGGTVIARISSYPLGELIRRMNSYSNNYMADRLLLLLGGNGGGRSGTRRIDSWLRSLDLPGSPPDIRDGSGLDPKNRASARQITEILRWAEARERIFPDLFASFARPGGAGTMERRFRTTNPPLQMRAKTGTLGESGVATIAGYIDAPGGGRYAFCILQQAASGSGIKVADLREREERWLAEFSRP